MTIKEKMWNYFIRLIKYVSLLVVVCLCFCLIDEHKDGFNFGIISLICWAFIFLDLARIKIKDFEIEFMTHKDALTADEKKEFVKCYDLLQQFVGFFLKDGYVGNEALECIWKARDQARLFLPKQLEEYVENYFQKALKAHNAHLLWKNNLQNPEKMKKWAEEKGKYEDFFLKMNIADTFKKYLKVKTNQ